MAGGAAVTTENQQKFVDLLRDYVKPSGQEQRLFKFVDSLQFEDLRDCASVYFEHDAEYAHQRSKSQAVFLKLSVRLVEQGDVYFALRLAILVRSPRTPWEIHYTALSAQDKSTLQKRLLAKKRSLTGVQREFIDLFDRYMKGQVAQNKVEAFSSALKTFEPRRDCLFAYVEVSQGYAARNERNSLLIFLGLSRATIWLGDAYFANAYKARVAEKDSAWHERYRSMDPEWQVLIQQDIKERLTIRSDAVIDKKTYKDAIVGQYKFDPVPAQKIHPEDRQQSAPLSNLQKQFLSLYEQFVDRGDRNSMDTFQEFLRIHKFEDLEACVLASLEDSNERHTGGNQRSQALFFGVVSAALTKGPAYYAFKVKFLTHTPGTIWNERFSALDKITYRDRLDAQINDEIKKKARLIDDVKAAYFAKHQVDPDLQALQTFEPASSQAQEERLSSALSDCEVAVAVSSVDSFERAFNDLSSVFLAEKDPLSLLVLIKRCKERQRLDARFRHLFYLYGVGILFGMVLRTRAVVYKAGFNAEEKQWLLEGSEAGNRYFIDFALQLEYAMWKRIGAPKPPAELPEAPRPESQAGAPTLTAMCKGQGILHIFADKFCLVLTPTIEAATLQGSVETLWRKRSKEVAALRIPIMSRRDGKKELRVAQTIGKFYILWWDFKHGTVYLLVNGLDQVVFETRQERLAEIYDDDAIYGEISRSTQHILVLMPIFWQIILYIPDLVSGGVTGLAKSIIINYAFEKSTEALGVDATHAQLFLLGVGLLAHGLKPREGGPKVEAELAATKHGIEPNAKAAAAQNRMIDGRATESLGGGATVRPLESRVGTDMRGIDRPGAVIEIRGSDPDVVANSRGDAPTSRATDAPDKHNRAIDPADRGTNDPHDDSAAFPGGEGGQGVREPPEIRRYEEGVSGKRTTRRKPVKRIKPAQPLPPRTEDRMPIRGDWSQQGRININRDGFRFRRRPGPGNTAPPVSGWREFEQGFNQQLAEPLANAVSDKPVVRTGPDDFGYRTRSSDATNQLKMQKGLAGPDGLMNRRPDASMMVVERLPGGLETIPEAHFFEATMQTDFQPGVGGAGHKQRQISGTLWLTEGRKGFTPDTRMYYHLFAPGPPTPATVEFLEGIMNQFPNLEINWFVVNP
jgi:hypothetical protein